VNMEDILPVLIGKEKFLALISQCGFREEVYGSIPDFAMPWGKGMNGLKQPDWDMNF